MSTATMGETRTAQACEVCGRPKWERLADMFHDAPQHCERERHYPTAGADMDCYRLGYEREKARAEKAEKELDRQRVRTGRAEGALHELLTAIGPLDDWASAAAGFRAAVEAGRALLSGARPECRLTEIRALVCDDSACMCGCRYGKSGKS